MTARLFRVIVPVPDVVKAAEFYSRLLGMPGEPVAGGSRHYFNCSGTILALANPAEHDAEWRPNPDYIYLSVPDLEQVFELAKAAGCKKLDEEITTQPWGERSFYAQDPFGNPICFVDEGTMFTGQGDSA